MFETVMNVSGAIVNCLLLLFGWPLLYSELNQWYTVKVTNGIR